MGRGRIRAMRDRMVWEADEGGGDRDSTSVAGIDIC